MSPAMFLRCLIWKHRRSSFKHDHVTVILLLLMDWPFMLDGFAFINPTNCESNISTVTQTCFKHELSFSCLNTLHSWSCHITTVDRDVVLHQELQTRERQQTRPVEGSESSAIFNEGCVLFKSPVPLGIPRVVILFFFFLLQHSHISM